MTSARFLTLGMAAATILAALAISGCSNPDAREPTPPAGIIVVDIPVGAYDPSSGGPWYLPATRDFQTPATIRWVNKDIALHQMVAYWEPLTEPTPLWVGAAQEGAAGHTHGTGGGHDHSSGSSAPHVHNGTPVFDVIVEAGATVDMPLLGEGRLMVHCHPHPWMVDTWDVQPDGLRDYAVNVSSLVLRGRQEAETAEKTVHELDWNLGVPNLRSVAAKLTWNDSADDFEGQADANKPDTLGLEIVAPNGTVMVGSTLQAREGEITVSYDIPQPVLLSTVQGASLAEARQNLSLQWPDWRGASGIWKVRVLVLAAPGPVDDVSLPPALPGADGSQAWTVQVEARHIWPTLGAPQEIPLASNPN